MHSSIRLQGCKAAKNQDGGECEMWVGKELRAWGDDVFWQLADGWAEGGER